MGAPKSVARYLGRQDTNYYFSVARSDYDTVLAWLQASRVDAYHAGLMPSAFANHRRKQPVLGIALSKISDVIQFEQRFAVSGLSLEALMQSSE